jgi:hypothetical protein
MIERVAQDLGLDGVRPTEPAPRVAPPPPPNPAKPIDLGEIDRYLAGLAKPT